ncbi:MAG: hypothetical protein HOE96_01815 [Candidatus Marinimicrobia bacterium]|nr:hypothetical protein [Candidatus Neomarinimicrobiota bacterium]
MAKKITVSCPQCGVTETYNRSFSTGSGSQPVQCKKCRRSFRIHYRSGDMYKVDKK